MLLPACRAEQLPRCVGHPMCPILMWANAHPVPPHTDADDSDYTAPDEDEEEEEEESGAGRRRRRGDSDDESESDPDYQDARAA